MDKPSRPRRGVYRVVLFVFGIGFGLAVAEGAVRALTKKDPDGRLRIGDTVLAPLRSGGWEAASKAGAEAAAAEDSYMVADAELGWSLRPDARDPAGLYATNSLGVRSLPRVDAPEPASGVSRVLAVGDSFTHCDEVPYTESWPHFLEAELGSAYEVLNGGVPGYGTDQAFLRWQKLQPQLHARIVLFGLLREDVLRNVNMFRVLEYARTNFPFSKPRFVLDGDKLRIVNSPVIPPAEIPRVLDAFAEHPLRPYEHWYLQPFYETLPLDASRLFCYLRSRLLWKKRAELQRAAYAPGSEAMRVTARVTARFALEAREAGATPIIVVIPSVKDLAALRGGGTPAEALIAALRSEGVGEVVNIGPRMLEALGGAEPQSFYVAGDGHLNAAGNRATAHILADEVAARARPAATPGPSAR